MFTYLSINSDRLEDGNGTSFILSPEIIFDAGNLLKPLQDDIQKIEHIFLTHSHFDHICDIPFIIETDFEVRNKPLNIYALKETIESLKEHIFNWKIWPAFHTIQLINHEVESMCFHEIKVGQSITFDKYEITPIPADHTDGSCGYLISEENEEKVLLTGDTGDTNSILALLQKDSAIKKVFIEASFPSRMLDFAKQTKHLSPIQIFDLNDRLENKDINFYIYHIKPPYKKEILEEIEVYPKKNKMHLA